MNIISSGIINNQIDDKYGKYGNVFCSIPLSFESYPENTICFAVIIEDFDVIPVCGYDWVHWLVANLEEPCLIENASEIGGNFLQGKNSMGNIKYYGMAPPDKDHIYDITIYALDTFLSLENGFTYEELKEKMKDHILEEKNIKAIYRK